MKVIFWGTPEFAIPTLNSLYLAGLDIVAVVTQPDKKRGRGREIIPSPIKQRANELGLNVITPKNIRTDKENQKLIMELKADISIVVAFGQILPLSLIENPIFGCWNGHASILPRWRGAGPIQWSIISGDSYTGVAIMLMEEGLDTGPVLTQKKIGISLHDNSYELSTKLANITADEILNLIKILEKYDTNTFKLTDLNTKKQDYKNDQITYARQIKKEDYIIDWNQECIKIHRQVKALYPHAYTFLRNKRLKIINTEPLINAIKNQLTYKASLLINDTSEYSSKPGCVIGIEKKLGIIISTSTEPILLKSAQLEGKMIKTGPELIQQLNLHLAEEIG